MRVLAVSAHPDDETLGCGGTLLKHRSAHDEMYWLIATQVFEPRWSSAVIATKAEEVTRVAEAYGMKEVFPLRRCTARLDTAPRAELIEAVANVIAQTRPEIVYVVHGGDVHTDHQVVFASTMAVLKPSYMARAGVRRILAFEVLSSTEAAPATADQHFVPTVFSDITSVLEHKLAIMALYESEAHADPFPRGPSAIRALARLRGATIGVENAEAFMLVRELV